MVFPLLRIASVLCLVAAVGPAARAAKADRKSDVPPTEVPKAVLDAAAKAVDGFAPTDATRLGRKAQVVYKLSGRAGGKAYALTVDARGRVLGVKVVRGAAAAARERRTGAAAARQQSPARLVGTIAHPSIRESSGVIASRRHAGVFWTHNDHGNAAALYAIDRTGKLLAEYAVAGAAADDWEDVATDDAGNLYIGNVGNNDLARTRVEVYRVAEPDPSTVREGRPATPLAVDKVWRLRFPAEPLNCESLVVRGGHGYVISKRADDRPAALYRFPLDAAAAAGDAVLEKVADLPVTSPVTAADLSRDGSRLAVLSRAGLYVFAVDGDVSRAASARPEVVPVPRGKLEGVCFAADGILLTSEKRHVYHLAR